MNETSLQIEIAPHVRAWCDERPVRLCAAFGSRARDTAHPESDLDLAIWPQRSVSGRELLEWHAELAAKCRLDVQIALVTPDLDPVLGMQIAKEGRAIFEATPGDWLSARVRLWQSYQDALPFLRASRERLNKFGAEARRGS